MLSFPPIASPTNSKPNNLSKSILSAKSSTIKIKLSNKTALTTDAPESLLQDTWQRPKAFKVLQNSLRKVCSTLKSTTVPPKDNKATVGLACFKLLLETSHLNKNFNDVFQTPGILPLILQVLVELNRQQTITNSKYIRTCCIYFIINHTASAAIGDALGHLLRTGAIHLLANTCFTDIASVTATDATAATTTVTTTVTTTITTIQNGHKDNQTAETARLSKFCYLAKNETGNTIRDLKHIATLALVEIFKYSAGFASQYDRFQYIDNTGVFEIVLRSRYHTEEQIQAMLGLYNLEDHVRFKHKGHWKKALGELVRNRFNTIIATGKEKCDKKEKQLEYFKKTQELVIDKSSETLVPRLNAIHLLSAVELYGPESIPLPETQRTVPTPSLHPDQLIYLSWQKIANMSLLAKKQMLKKSKLEKTFASAEYCKADAQAIVSRDRVGSMVSSSSVLSSGINDTSMGSMGSIGSNRGPATVAIEASMTTAREKERQQHYSSTLRVLKVAKAEYALYEVVILASKHGFNNSNTTNIVALEHGENVARKIMQLELSRLNAVETDTTILLEPIRNRKNDQGNAIDIKLKLLRRKAVHLEREMRANLSASNNAAAAAAAVAAVAAAQVGASTGGADGNEKDIDSSTQSPSRRRRRRHRMRNNSAAAAEASGAIITSTPTSSTPTSSTPTSSTPTSSTPTTSTTSTTSTTPKQTDQGATRGGGRRRERRKRSSNRSSSSSTNDQRLVATPDQLKRKKKLTELKEQVSVTEMEAKRIHTSKLIDMCNEDERLSYAFLKHALATIKCNVACAVAALDVVSQQLNVERIIHETKEHSNKLDASVHNWERLMGAMENLRQATVHNAVALSALAVRTTKTTQERLAWVPSSSASAPSALSAATSTSTSTLTSMVAKPDQLALSATTADLNALRNTLNIVSSSRLGVLHPRVLGMRQHYVSGTLQPSLELGTLYQALALAKTKLNLFPQHLKDTSMYQQYNRRVEFYRWRVAINDLHASSNVHGYHVVQNALHDNHATPHHLMHKAGVAAVNVLTEYYGEVVQSEIAFSNANELLLASETKEGITGTNSVFCHLLSMHSNEDKELPWHKHCDLTLSGGTSIRTRAQKMMMKVREFAKSAKACTTLANVQVHKVIDMINSVENSGTLTPTMRISIEREETIFNATKKKLHFANLMLAENYSMLYSTIEAEKAKLVAENQTLDVSIRNDARLAQSTAENFMIVSNKILGSATGNLSEKELKAMREEMEKMREKTLREDKKKQIISLEKEKKKMMEQAKQRNEKFQKEKREKKQQERMHAIKLKETELRNIRNIKLAKKKQDAAMHAKRKADLRLQEKILANKKSQWATEKMETKKMQREQILEHHMDAKSCAKHVVRLIIYDRLEPLIDESEARGFKKRKEKILHNKKMIKQAKNWEQEDDGSWLNWRTKETQWEAPECIQVMWEVTGTGSSAVNEWELLYDEDGYGYYYNKSTGESSFEKEDGAYYDY